MKTRKIILTIILYYILGSRGLIKPCIIQEGVNVGNPVLWESCLVIGNSDILGLQLARVDEPLSHFQRLLIPKFKVIPQPFNRGLTYAAELYSFLPSSLKIFSFVLTAKGLGSECKARET